MKKKMTKDEARHRLNRAIANRIVRVHDASKVMKRDQYYAHPMLVPYYITKNGVLRFVIPPDAVSSLSLQIKTISALMDYENLKTFHFAGAQTIFMPCNLGSYDMEPACDEVADLIRVHGKRYKWIVPGSNSRIGHSNVAGLTADLMLMPMPLTYVMEGGTLTYYKNWVTMAYGEPSEQPKKVRYKGINLEGTLNETIRTFVAHADQALAEDAMRAMVDEVPERLRQPPIEDNITAGNITTPIDPNTTTNHGGGWATTTNQEVVYRMYRNRPPPNPLEAQEPPNDT